MQFVRTNKLKKIKNTNNNRKENKTYQPRKEETTKRRKDWHQPAAIRCCNNIIRRSVEKFLCALKIRKKNVILYYLLLNILLH